MQAWSECRKLFNIFNFRAMEYIVCMNFPKKWANENRNYQLFSSTEIYRIEQNYGKKASIVQDFSPKSDTDFDKNINYVVNRRQCPEVCENNGDETDHCCFKFSKGKIYMILCISSVKSMHPIRRFFGANLDTGFVYLYIF